MVQENPYDCKIASTAERTKLETWWYESLECTNQSSCIEKKIEIKMSQRKRAANKRRAGDFSHHFSISYAGLEARVWRTHNPMVYLYLVRIFEIVTAHLLRYHYASFTISFLCHSQHFKNSFSVGWIDMIYCCDFSKICTRFTVTLLPTPLSICHPMTLEHKYY